METIFFSAFKCEFICHLHIRAFTLSGMLRPNSCCHDTLCLQMMCNVGQTCLWRTICLIFFFLFPLWSMLWLALLHFNCFCFSLGKSKIENWIKHNYQVQVPQNCMVLENTFILLSNNLLVVLTLKNFQRFSFSHSNDGLWPVILSN